MPLDTVGLLREFMIAGDLRSIHPVTCSPVAAARDTS